MTRIYEVCIWCNMHPSILYIVYNYKEICVSSSIMETEDIFIIISRIY